MRIIRDREIETAKPRNRRGEVIEPREQLMQRLHNRQRARR